MKKKNIWVAGLKSSHAACCQRHDLFSLDVAVVMLLCCKIKGSFRRIDSDGINHLEPVLSGEQVFDSHPLPQLIRLFWFTVLVGYSVELDIFSKIIK